MKWIFYSMLWGHVKQLKIEEKMLEWWYFLMWMCMFDCLGDGASESSGSLAKNWNYWTTTYLLLGWCRKEKLVNEKLLNVHSVMPLSPCFWIETLFFSCNKILCYLCIHIEIKWFISLRIIFHEYNRWLIITMILNWQTSSRASF